jgi:hypothetical protein
LPVDLQLLLTTFFFSLKRDGKGRFNDADLAKILQDATEWRAREFGARGTPEVLRVIEIMGMKQARSWGTCSARCVYEVVERKLTLLSCSSSMSSGSFWGSSVSLLLVFGICPS